MSAFTPPPVAPNRGDRATFSGRVDAFLTWMVAFVTQLLGFESNLNILAAGGANSFAYNFDSAILNTDPGPGKFRFNSATQSAATAIYLDPITAGNIDVSGPLNALLSVSSVIKGSIRIQKANDVSKWLLFDVTGSASGTGYVGLLVTPRAGSGSSPFAAGDSLVVFVDRNGDMGGAPTSDQIKNALGTLPVASGGTGATTTAAALTNLGALPAAGGTMTGTFTVANAISMNYLLANGVSRIHSLLDASNVLNITNTGGTNTRILSGDFSRVLATMDDNGIVGLVNSFNIDVTSVNPASAITLKNTNSNGLRIALNGNGSNPNKFIRLANGLLDVVNSAFSASIFGLSDAGNLTVAGTVTAQNFTATSDENEKYDWQPAAVDLVERVADIGTYGVFTWKKDGSTSVGVGAQSLEKIMPEAVHTDENGKKSVNYGGASMFLAIELAKKVQELSEELKQLKAKSEN